MKKIVALLFLLTTILSAFIFSFVYFYQSNMTYTIRYYSDTADTSSINLVYKSHKEIHLIVNPYEKEGYRFKGWNIDGVLYNEYASYIMPENDVNIFAEWIKIIHVNLEANNGSTILPLNIDQGSTLDYSDLPLPKKDGYLFDDWFLDSDLTVKYNAGVYKLNSDTKLYAKYSSINEENTKIYSTDEKILLNQNTNFNIELYSDIELTNENINDYINIQTTSGTFVSDFNIEKIDTNIYNLKLAKELNKENNYVFNTNNSSVYYLVKENNTKTVYNNVKEEVIEFTNEDYYYISNNEMFLKEEYVYNNEIKLNEVIKITNNNQVDYAKIKKIDVRTINHNNKNKNVLVLTLSSVSFSDVYDFLHMNENKIINLNSYLNQNSVSKIKKALTTSKEITNLQNLYVETVKDYLSSNQDIYNISNELINNARIENDKTNVSVNLTSKGFDINASFIITLDENIYFEVNMNILENLNIILNSNLNLINDLTDFDIFTKVDSSTTIEMNIIFNNKGEKINIKEDVNSLISNLPINEFYNKYNEYLNYETGKIDLLDINLVNIETTLNNFIDIKIPINIKLNLGINSPLFTKITINSSKIYGLKFNNNVFETYHFDNTSSHTLDATYNGHFKIEKGMVVGLDVSFKEFDNLGSFGYSIYNAVNYDIFGSSNLLIEDNLISSSSGKYFEIKEIYNEYVYNNSSHYNLYDSYISQNDQLISSGGNQYMVFDFVDKTKEINHLNLINGYLNLNDYNLFCLSEMNLKTGKLENIVEDRNTFSIITSGYFNYDKETGILSIKDEYKNLEIYGTIILRYTGNIYNKDKYIEQIISVYHDPSTIIKDNQDTSSFVKVTYMINDEIYYEEEVPYNSYHIPSVYVNDEFYQSHPNIEYAYFNTLEAISSPLTKDTVFNAKIVYKKVTVTFEYEAIENNELVTKQERVIATCSVDKVKDLTTKLIYFEPNITNKCTFIEWENNNSVIEYKENQVFKAIYNKQNLDIVLEIDKVVVNNSLLLDKQIINLNIPFGTVPQFNYTTLTGFKLVYLDYNDEKLYTNKLIKAQLIREKDYNITFYDYYGNPILISSGYFGEDLSTLLSNENVINYKYPETLSVNEQAILSGWLNSDKLSFIETNIELYPIFEINNVTQKVIFNLNGGSFDNIYSYIEKDGYSVNKGSIISSTILENLIPVKPSTETHEYIFDGWYQGNTKIDLSTYQVTRDITLTARYKEVVRKYSMEIFANGVSNIINLEDLTLDKLTVEATFINGENILVGDDLSLTDVKKILTYISTLSNQDYIPLPVDEQYSFDRYIISIENNTYTLVPLYKTDATNTTIVYNFSINNEVNNYQEMYQAFVEEDTIAYSTLYVPQIENSISVSYYDFDENVIKETLCAYKDDNFYYIFKGWSLDQETILEEDSLVDYNETIELFAVYEKHNILKTATFNVSDDETESIVIDGVLLNEYIINSNYNSLIENEFIPTASKLQQNKNLYYQYKFIGWYCIESDSMVLNNFNNDYHYIPKFEKVISK